MDMVKSLKPHTCCKLEIQIKGKTFQAILDYVDPVTTKVGLTYAVRTWPTKANIGVLSLLAEDILSYNIIDHQKIQRCNNSVGYQPIACAPQKYVNWLKCGSESSDEEGGNIEEEEEEEAFVLEIPEDFEDVLPNDQVFIDYIDENFHLAIEHISKQKTIGVGFEGTNLGRFGELCIVSISTERCTFLFDICALKGDAFKDGLKNIFENPNIEKIIHNCMRSSDALFNLYDTEIVNVFDTQVSHLFIEKIHRRNGIMKEKAWSMTQCLKRYLGIDREQLFISKYHFFAVRSANPDWTCRPLPNELRAVAIRNVIFLRLLRNECINRMMGEFYKAVDIVNGIVRDRTTEDLELEKADPEFYQDLNLGGLNVKVIQVSAYFGGNKKNPVEDYLNKTKDYEAFKPRPSHHQNEYVDANSAFGRRVTSSPPPPASDFQELKIAEDVTNKTALQKVPTQQPKLPLREENSKQHKVSAREVVGIGRGIFIDKRAFTSTIGRGRDASANITKPTVSNNTGDFEWPKVETDGRTASISLMPAGITIPAGKKKSPKQHRY